MALMDGAYPSEDARREFFMRAVRALRANPQFESAAMTDRFRMTFAGGGQYEVDGQNYLTDRDRPRCNFESVSDNYFTTLRLKVLEGRDFTIEDTDSKQPVAIVNASFARKYWGNQSAIGHQVRIFNPAQPQPWRTIVGVVPDNGSPRLRLSGIEDSDLVTNCALIAPVLSGKARVHDRHRLFRIRVFDSEIAAFQNL